MRWRREKRNQDHPPPEPDDQEPDDQEPDDLDLGDPHFWFWFRMNEAMGFLEPAERKALNEVRRVCALYGLIFPEALALCMTAPEEVPREVLRTIRRADQAGIFIKVSLLFD